MNLANRSMKELVAIHNEAAEKLGNRPVKRFSSLAAGIKRTRCQLDELSAKEGEQAKKAVGRGRPSQWAGKVIVAVRSENPRRAGTHGHRSMEIIIEAGEDGLTYEEFVSAGGRSNDLRWDIEHNNVVVG